MKKYIFELPNSNFTEFWCGVWGVNIFKNLFFIKNLTIILKSFKEFSII